MHQVKKSFLLGLTRNLGDDEESDYYEENFVGENNYNIALNVIVILFFILLMMGKFANF